MHGDFAVNILYLRSVRQALATLRGEFAGTATAETLLHCTRVLATLEHSWSVQQPTMVPESLPESPGCPRFHIGPPPESAAVQPATIATIGRTATLLDGTHDPSTLDRDEVQALIAWEAELAGLGADALDRMENIPARADGAGSGADRGLDAGTLATYLRARTGNADLEVVSLRPVEGGRSRRTALFEVANAPDLPQRMAIQLPLAGIPQFIGTGGEFRLLGTLHDIGMKVPRPLLYQSEAAHGLGALLVTEQVDGTVPEKNYFAAIRSPGLARSLARQMALLHGVPAGALRDIVPPATHASGRQAWLSELETFWDYWRSHAHAPSIVVSAAFAWLRANVDVVEQRETVVHRDMVFHNVLAEGEEITAVLDWEQAGLGHPGEDVGYCYPMVAPHTDWNEFLAEYRRSGGVAMSQREIDFFAIRAIVRILMLSMQGRDGFELGHADDVFRATVGAHFLQRLLRRLGDTLTVVLERPRSGKQ